MYNKATGFERVTDMRVWGLCPASDLGRPFVVEHNVNVATTSQSPLSEQPLGRVIDAVLQYDGKGHEPKSLPR